MEIRVINRVNMSPAIVASTFAGRHGVITPENRILHNHCSENFRSYE
jgi:hypothetical protein